MGSKFGTVNGHSLFECSSAMQKSVRRGEIDDAMYFAVELDMSGYGEYLWRRLRTIASEDIGLANPHLPATLSALYESWVDFANREQKTDRIFLAHAVLLLCTSAKSRIADNLQIAHYASHERREVPDYAYDMHTQKGRQMGRGVEHFFASSTVVDRAVGDAPHPVMEDVQYGRDPWEPEARRLKTTGQETAPKVVRSKAARQAVLAGILDEERRGNE